MDLTKFDIRKYNMILDRGLCFGLGSRDSTMCIEAAICYTLGLPHGDDPECVAESVRRFKIALNDSGWSSQIARSKGLYSLGLAQLGSLGVVNDKMFQDMLFDRVTKQLLPEFLESLKVSNEIIQKLRTSETWESLNFESDFMPHFTRLVIRNISDCLFSASLKPGKAAGTCIVEAVENMNRVSNTEGRYDVYLIKLADIALQILKDLGSPGVALLDKAVS